MNENENETLKEFQDLRSDADGYYWHYERGFLTLEEMMAKLDKLHITDHHGVEWKISFPFDIWYKLEEGEWVQAVPPVPSMDLLTDPDKYIPSLLREYVILTPIIKRLRKNSDNDENR